MRISALSSIVVLTAVAGSAHADRATEYRYHARTHEVAAVEAPYTYAPSQPGALSTGKIALTGATHARADIDVEAAPIARRDPFLSNKEITAGVAPYATEIEHCYLAQVGTAHAGKLDVTLLIGRDGGLVSLKAAAAGASAQATHKIERCVRQIVETVQFPERRNDTTAVVPYVFHKMSAPGDGPQLSCWNAKGC